jgi:hypothetical protein
MRPKCNARELEQCGIFSDSLTAQERQWAGVSPVAGLEHHGLSRLTEMRMSPAEDSHALETDSRFPTTKMPLG